jgi:plastocyanin
VASVRDAEGNPVINAVVILNPIDIKNIPHKAPVTREIDQIDKEFINRVTAIQTGTRIDFPNRDNVRHHVYSFSPAKPFELPLYSGIPADPVLFDKPGIVKIGCNIHDWMIGYIYVTNAPYFTVTTEEGTARLEDLEAGNYIASIWHPLMKKTEESSKQPIEIHTGATEQANWQIDLRPDIRPRRSPVPMSRGYR